MKRPAVKLVVDFLLQVVLITFIVAVIVIIGNGS